MVQPDQTGDAPLRRWLPSPGCSFIVTLFAILVLVCSWFGWRVRQQQARREQIDQIGRDGPTVGTEPAVPEWLYDLATSALGEEQAAGLTDITAIYFMEDPDVTDADLLYLSNLTNLRILWLNNVPVTDAGLERLSRLANLRELVIAITEVTDAGLEHLRGLTRLERLSLDGNRITDSGLEHLSGLTNLKYLSLYDTQVTDAGLQHLSGLTNLQELDLEATHVTDGGADKLQAQLPHVEIIRYRDSDQ